MKKHSEEVGSVMSNIIVYILCLYEKYTSKSTDIETYVCTYVIILKGGLFKFKRRLDKRNKADYYMTRQS